MLLTLCLALLALACLVAGWAHAKLDDAARQSRERADHLGRSVGADVAARHPTAPGRA